MADPITRRSIAPHRHRRLNRRQTAELSMAEEAMLEDRMDDPDPGWSVQRAEVAYEREIESHWP